MGLDLGLERAGINQLLACEIDSHCRNTINKNRPELPVLEDILRYSADDIREVSGLKKGERPLLVVGGPPCQAFSTAGKRKGFEDPRGNVLLHYINLIGSLSPEYAVIENVRGLLSAPLIHRPHNQRGKDYPPISNDEKPGGALTHILRLLSSFGYEVSFNLYNAANYGVPQKRERVILIASRSGIRVPHLKPTNSEDGKYGLPKWITFSEAVEGLDRSEATSVKFPEKRLRYYRMLKSGQYWKDLPNEEIKREAMGKSYFAGGGKTGFYRRLDWDKPSPTLVTHPAMPATDLAHPEDDRPLSVEEYRRIQQFPDDWELSGSIVEQYKQIGNAVPIGLGEVVGKSILDHMNGHVWDEREMSGFSYSRYKNTDEISWKKKHNYEDVDSEDIIQQDLFGT